MSAALLLLLSLSGLAVAEEPPDVDCLIVHLKHINCSWNKPAAPRVNYTFHSRFGTSQKPSSCSSYTEENGVRTGCVQPYEPTKSDRFNVFYITLSHGNQTSEQSLNLKSKVKLNPPVNLTVQNGSDYNLWFYWNQTKKGCVESEIRYRTNYNKWEFNKLQTMKQDFCINLPSSSSRYELQVRSRIGNSCGESEFWSDWSEPVVWGFNSTVPNQTLASAWTPFFYVVGAFTLVLLVTLLLHHERLRIIPIPVPKPLPVFHKLEDWLQYPKVQKEDFKTNYNELVCSVSEYRPDPTDSESSDGSSSSVTTDQTDCSVCIVVTKEEEEFSPDCSSSSSSSSAPMLPEPQE